jgi:hypothetical protein
MSTLVLGSEITLSGKPALVVRIVKSQSIFERQTFVELVDEIYAEVRKQDGTPEFVQLSLHAEQFNHKKSEIKALDPLWRPK